MKTEIHGRTLRGLLAAALLGLAVTPNPVLAGGEGPTASPAVRLLSGRLDAGGGTIVESGALRTGTFYEVVGAKAAQLDGPAGTSFRAMPGAKFLVDDADASHVGIRLSSGVIADAKGDLGIIDLATPAGTLRGDHATIYARVLPRGVYVEHEAASTGTAGLFSPGAPLVTLAPGTFRMMSLDAGDPPPAGAPPAGAPQAGAPQAGSVAAGADDPTKAVPVAPAPPTVVVPSASGPATVVPCAPCAPPPCLPCPRCCGCGELIRHSGVPVPYRVDPTARPPLGTVLGPCACSPDAVCACKCGKIPYVHYVEGLECDVTTYRVGNCLVTVRPASRVRVTRLPDGGLQLWAPNLGKDLALIEVGENQFGYIGDDGFLVVGCDCQFQSYGCLVHLYPSPGRLWPWINPPKRRDLPATDDFIRTFSVQMRSGR